MRKPGKKDITLIVLGFALIISAASNGVLILNYPKKFTQRDLLNLVVGTSSGPITLEIVDCWDRASEDVLGQVVETLFTNDLRDPNLPRINLLAETYWWENSTTLHIKLREGILFHDGTPFNGSAAKWNMDRLQFLINAWGNNTGEVAHTSSIFMRPDGITPIINNTVTNGEYNITITLNGAYGPFLNTLTLINTGMISPTAHQDHATSFIELNTEKLVGTAPFVFKNYIPDAEVVFSRWNEYWNHVAYFKTLRYKIYDYHDTNSAHQDMLNGQIDFNFMASKDDMLVYETKENIIVKHYTDDTGLPSLVYQYLGFNNENFNKTCRKAMSYAINYSYIVEDLLQGGVIQAKSPISAGFGLPFNETTKFPEFNIAKAREIMVSMGFGDISWNDEQWIAVANGTSPFLTINYTYPIGNTIKKGLLTAITQWFKLIGITVEDDGYTWIELVTWGVTFDGMFWIGWAPDYPDPFNMLDPLVNPNSDDNYANINDTTLNSMMALALETTDDVARNTIYKNIQSYMAEVGYFHVPLYHSKIYFVHSAYLQGIPYNAIGKFQAYGIWRD